MRATHSVLGRRTRFQHVQDRPIAEAGISPRPEFPDAGRTGVKTAGQQLLAACPSSRITAPQFDIPEERGVCFHAKKRVIGSLTAIPRIVANLSPLLVTAY